jgi:DNA-binding Lrp family transcriptional regulator
VQQLSLARRLGLRAPAQQRALAGLLTGSRRSNRVIGRDVQVPHKRVRQVRHILEAAGVIEVYRAPSGRNQAAVDLARELLAAGPAQTSRAIAAKAGCGKTAVDDARHEMERDGLICIYRAGTHVASCWCGAS